MDVHSLERFIPMHALMYSRALGEIKSGKKRTHWMWYIFPCLRSLGKSRNSYIYGIESLDEAREYLEHEILGEHLVEISKALLALDTQCPQEIFSEIDTFKLASCATLFLLVDREETSVFSAILDKFFEGKADTLTLERLGAQLPEKE